tara:strand:- start:215 stop:472 length:258 start_codon:yes stop_codon:yes gene_type:complete
MVGTENKRWDNKMQTRSRILYVLSNKIKFIITNLSKMFSPVVNKIIEIQNEKKKKKLLEKKQRQQEWVMNSIQEIKRIFPEMVEE